MRKAGMGAQLMPHQISIGVASGLTILLGLGEFLDVFQVSPSYLVTVLPAQQLIYMGSLSLRGEKKPYPQMTVAWPMLILSLVALSDEVEVCL